MERNRELVFSVNKKDLEISYFSGTGKGGQHRNKHQNCVRLRHPDSGVSTTGQSFRERSANTKEALNNLVNHPKFKVWSTRKFYEVVEGKSVEKKVEDMLDEKNLKIEVKKDGKWVSKIDGRI